MLLRFLTWNRNEGVQIMSIIQYDQAKEWREPFTSADRQAAIQNVEQGKVLYFPNLSFSLEDKEQLLLSTHSLSAHSKNISFNPKSATLGGVQGDNSDLKEMMQRFSMYAFTLIGELFPHYKSHLVRGRTSYRPAEIAGRKSSYRKDDTRLHVDAFPSSPNQGNRILRVFSNLNPQGKSRVWRLGEPFEDVANGFLPRVRKPIFGSSALLRALSITKSRRTPYDHYMLQLHNLMKADLAYQKDAPQLEFHFPPQSSWVVMTDHVSHAAMSGQYMLEQTFYLPVAAMQNESLSPLRVLERLVGRGLI